MGTIRRTKTAKDFESHKLQNQYTKPFEASVKSMVLDHSMILPGRFQCLLSTSNKLNVNSLFFTSRKVGIQLLLGKGYFFEERGQGAMDGWEREWKRVVGKPVLLRQASNWAKHSFWVQINTNAQDRRNSRTVFKGEYQENEGSEGRMRVQRGEGRRREIGKGNKGGECRGEMG